MSGVEFLDSNVLIYAYDPVDGKKQRIARELIGSEPPRLFVISTQVLAALASIPLHKSRVKEEATGVL